MQIDSIIEEYLLGLTRNYRVEQFQKDQVNDRKMNLLRLQSKHHSRILNPHIQVPIAALLYITHTTHVD